MNSKFDLYVARPGWAHRIDPRVKLLFVFVAVVSMIMFSNLFLFLVALASMHLLIASAGVPLDRIKWVWKAMLPINFMIPVLWMLFYPEGTPFFQFWILRFTPLGLIRGLGVAARLDTIAFIVFLWLFTTDQTSIIRSLVKLRMPFKWGLVLALGLRYMPSFAGLFTVITEAQQARALDLSRGNAIQKVKSYIPILAAMLISSLRTADQLGDALESRALGLKGVRRTSLYEVHANRRDYLLSAALLLAFCGAIVLRVLGFFVHPLHFVP